MTEAIIVDARGLRCPLPVLRLARAGRAAQPGTVFDLIADDPAAQIDVPAFVREAGWEGVKAAPDTQGATHYIVTR
jgi:tRNA 2-thiouridine synthesizing protein A